MRKTDWQTHPLNHIQFMINSFCGELGLMILWVMFSPSTPQRCMPIVYFQFRSGKVFWGGPVTHLVCSSHESELFGLWLHNLKIACGRVLFGFCFCLPQDFISQGQVLLSICSVAWSNLANFKGYPCKLMLLFVWCTDCWISRMF